MKYQRPESSKTELRRMTRKLFKRVLELERELHPWREFKKAILAGAIAKQERNTAGVTGARGKK